MLLKTNGWFKFCALRGPYLYQKVHIASKNHLSSIYSSGLLGWRVGRYSPLDVPLIQGSLIMIYSSSYPEERDWRSLHSVQKGCKFEWGLDSEWGGGGGVDGVCFKKGTMRHGRALWVIPSMLPCKLQVWSADNLLDRKGSRKTNIRWTSSKDKRFVTFMQIVKVLSLYSFGFLSFDSYNMISHKTTLPSQLIS